MKIDTIVVPVDFSDVTPQVVRHATEMAKAFGSRIILLHISEPEPDFVGYEAGPQAVRATVARDFRTEHRDLGPTAWYTVSAGAHRRPRAAWQHTGLPDYAGDLKERVAFAWRAMDSFYEEDDRIVGHAADMYHRIDIRQSSRHLTVRSGDRVVADTARPLVLYESGFAPRWYVPRADVDGAALTPAGGQTFCPYKGLCSYYDIADAHQAAWSYPDAWPEVSRISGLVSFEPDRVAVHLDGTRLRLEPGQTVIPHGVDRDLSTDEVNPGRQP